MTFKHKMQRIVASRYNWHNDIKVLIFHAIARTRGEVPTLYFKLTCSNYLPGNNDVHSEIVASFWLFLLNLEAKFEKEHNLL
jgi:hypothetical protein